jgi:hypothetical protein
MRNPIFLRGLLCLAAGIFLAAIPAGAQQAVVYTAIVQDAHNVPDSVLAEIARESGTQELMIFSSAGPVERRLLDFGDAEVAFPGFTSLNRVMADQSTGPATGTDAQGRTIRQLDFGQGALEWRIPKSPGQARFEAQATAEGDLLYTEYRTEKATSSGGLRPETIRVNYNDGSALIQIYDYDDEVPVPQGPTPDLPFTPLRADIVDKYEGVVDFDPAKAVQNNGVTFSARREVLDLGFDTGYWPGGGSSPGGFPVQARLAAFAVWANGAELNGEILYENGVMRLGNASGSVDVDFGVETIFQGAVNIPFLPPITFDLPYLPNFDWRATGEAQFNGWLFNGSVMASDQTAPRELFNLNITSLLGVPDWFPVSAGASVDVAMVAATSMRGELVRLSDGRFFTSTNDQVPLAIPENGYNVTAQYIEHADMTVTLNFMPSLYVSAFGQRFDLPLGTLGWAPIDGETDFNWTPQPVNFQAVPVVLNPTDFLTERFFGNNDLEYRTLTFSQDGTQNFYTPCIDGAFSFPVDPADGNVVALENDNSVKVTPSKAVPFFGIAYNDLYIGSNGYITFSEGDGSAIGNEGNHFSLPRVSAFFEDLDPSAGGTVSWKETESAVVVTYEDVPLSSGGAVSAQVALQFDGTVVIALLGLDSDNGLVGLSQGTGVHEGYVPSDLSASDFCSNACFAALGGSEVGLANLYATAVPDVATDEIDIDLNGMVDTAHLRMLDQVLFFGSMPGHCETVDVWQENASIVNAALGNIPAKDWAGISREAVQQAITGLGTVGSYRSIQDVLELLGIRTRLGLDDELLNMTVANRFSAEGDFDGDGVCNLAEYNAMASATDFVNAATNGDLVVDGGGCGLSSEGESEGEVEGETDPEGEDPVPGQVVCEVFLSGSQVVLPTTTSAAGTATFRWDDTGSQVVLEIAHNVEDPLAVTINEGGPGENGHTLVVLSAEVNPVFAVFSPATFEQLRDGHYIEITSEHGPSRTIRGNMTCPKISDVLIDLGGDPEGEDTPTEGETEGGGDDTPTDSGRHDGDLNGDGQISLSELLRMVQLFNIGGYHCDTGAEDGFAVGGGDRDECDPHSLDYAPSDWEVQMSELLRGIQFYNAGGYAANPGTEDGFAPGRSAS